MYSLLFLCCVSFALSLVITPFVRNLSRRMGGMDQPDSGRKHHERAIPRVGGVAIALSFAGSLALLLPFPTDGATIVRESLPFVLRIIPAGLLILGVGLLDDLWGLKPWQKFAGQTVAALAAYWGGIRVQTFGGHEFADWWTLPLTVFWLVLCANALNLIDGLDGLAVGVGLFAGTTTLMAAMLQGNFALAIATVPLVGCLLGFLRYNFNPATIFLGDSGSLFLGFLLGCYGVLWSQKSATLLGMTAPLMALAIPLLDTGIAVVRRFLSGKPIFSGDRGHIHHRLLDRGLTPAKVAMVVYAVCGVAALFSLLMASQRFEGLVIFVFCAVAWIGIQHLGYVEFGTAGRIFLEGAFRRQLRAQIALQHYEKLLNETATPEECWTVVEKVCRQFGLQRASLVLGGERFEYRSPHLPDTCWQIQIPLADRDFIQLSRAFEDTSHADVVAPLTDMLRRTLQPKSESLERAPRKVLYRVAGNRD